MLPLEGHRRFRVGEGALVDQQVGAAGQGHRRLAKHRVGAIHEAGPRPRRAAEAGAANDAAVVEADGAAQLQLGIDRARRDAQLLGAGHIEATGPRFLIHPVGVGRHPMGERRAAHSDITVIEQQLAAGGGLAHGVGAQRIADAGGAVAQHPLQKIGQWIGAVEIHAGAATRQPHAGQQARQPKYVVAVHVGDEDTAELAHPQFTAQKLMLGALAAVK